MNINLPTDENDKLNLMSQEELENTNFKSC